MYKLVKFLMVFVCTVSLTLPAYAAFDQVGNQTVCVSGETDAPNTMVSLQVFKGTKGPQDLKLPELLNPMDIIVCHDQSITDSEGNYSFTFNIGSSSGTYTAYVSFEGEGSPVIEEIFFVDTVDLQSALLSLKQADSKEKVKEIIEEKSGVLGFTDDSDSPVKTAGVAEILYNYIQKNGISEDDRNEAIAIYEKCLFVQKINENKIENVFDDTTLAQFEESAVSGWYESDFITDDLKEEMTKKLSNNGFKSIEEYIEGITEAFVLATVRYPNGYENLKAVLEAFYDEVGIKQSNVTAGVCRKLSGKDYETLDELSNAISDILDENGGSAGGSSGGSSGGGAKKPVNVEIGGFTEPTAPQEIPKEKFSDINEISWAKDSINYLAERGIISGKEDGKFCPNDMVTREEFVKMIVEAFGIEKHAEINFDDVKENDWYYQYVQRAYASGVISGMSENMFGAGRNITRQDMAVICLNVAKNIGINTKEISEEIFEDDAGISDYAKEAVYTLKGLKIINGMSDNCFEPQGYTTRAQAAVILHKLLSV